MGNVIDTSNLDEGDIATIIYSFVSLIIFLCVCVLGWQKVKILESQEEQRKKKTCSRITRWMSLVWKMKSIYLSALVHIYDIGTVRRLITKPLPPIRVL